MRGLPLSKSVIRFCELGAGKGLDILGIAHDRDCDYEQCINQS